MKKLLLTAFAVTCAVSVFAQGTVIFNNRVTGSVVTHVYGPETGDPMKIVTGNTAADTPAGTTVYTGAALVGTGYLAQLLAANGANQTDLAAASTAPLSFRTQGGAAAGFLNPGNATLTGVPADAATATIRMVVWDNSSGNYANWNAATIAAWQAGTIAAGMSPSFNLNAIGGVNNPSPNLVGLQSFNIYFVPEPSTMALAGLGAAALLIFRRRK